MKRTMRLVTERDAKQGALQIDEHDGCNFCERFQEAAEDLNISILSVSYPRGAKLFAEGQAPKGVFLLASGRAKLWLGSSRGKSLMRIAEPGEMMGLSAALSGRPYEGSAEIIEAGNVSFIARDQFLTLIHSQAEAMMHVAGQLSKDYLAAQEQLRMLMLSHSVMGKIARLLLNWCEIYGRQIEDGIQMKPGLTHGEMAQIIGASRETVSRILGELQNMRVIELRGSNLLIKNKVELNLLANS